MREVVVCMRDVDLARKSDFFHRACNIRNAYICLHPTVLHGNLDGSGQKPPRGIKTIESEVS